MRTRGADLGVESLDIETEDTQIGAASGGALIPAA
jgi:hypothetical protein